MLARFDAEALVFGADEDGGDDVAGAAREVSVICERGEEDFRQLYMKTASMAW